MKSIGLLQHLNREANACYMMEDLMKSKASMMDIVPDTGLVLVTLECFQFLLGQIVIIVFAGFAGEFTYENTYQKGRVLQGFTYLDELN